MTLKEWRENLLDLGKGNRLLNFKKSKNSTLTIEYPDVFTIYQQAADDFVFFDADHREPDTSSFKKNELLALGEDGLYKTLKNLSKKTQESVIEKGISPLYIACGFLEWNDGEGTYEAPIVLIPAQIVLGGLSKTSKLVILEEEKLINPTLKYKLQMENNITLEDDFESIEEYFGYLQKKVMPLEWKVNYKCALGLFSFMKMNMYMDLKNNETKIMANQNVRILLGEPISVVPKKENSDYMLHNVVDADSSQTEAIRRIKRGDNLVLQGPPGTGKSQTITNIIAEALADNKKVLFVSEKMAALQVVYQNLKKVGLDEFCLELHSHKTNKKEFINVLYDILYKPKKTLTSDIFAEIEELTINKEHLDSYASLLHRNNPGVEKSLFAIYGELAELGKIEEVEFIIKNLPSKGPSHLKTAGDLFNKYQNGLDLTGYNYKNSPWYGYINRNNRYEDIIKTKDSMSSIIKFLDEINDFKEDIYQNYGIIISNVKKVYAVKGLFQTLYGLEISDDDFFDSIKLSQIINELKDKQKISAEILMHKKEVDKIFDEGIYSRDWELIYRRYKSEYTGLLWFNRKYKKDRDELRKYQLDNRKIKHEPMLIYLTHLYNFQHMSYELDKRSGYLKKVLKTKYQSYMTNYEEIIKALEQIQKINEIIDLSPLRTREIKQEQIKRFYDVLEYVLNRNEALYQGFNKSLDDKVIDLENLEFLVIKKRLNNMLRHFDDLNAWINFLQLHEQLKENELLDYLNEVIALNMSPNNFFLAYKKAYYLQYMHNIFAENEELSHFSRLIQDDYVKTFISKDRLQFEISKAQIITTLSCMRPDTSIIAPKSPAALITREFQKKRKQMPVRLILQTIPDFVQTLKPCFLMSPLSVSTYLDDIYFDLVIFDEASQIFPEDAIGAIYRAKQLVVVGDTKQMPPSNFFKTNSIDTNEDDYTESVNDYESILDICATHFMQYRLKWHYRSKTESLISFSNDNFYDSQLVSFPSNMKDKEDFGIELVYTPKGEFSRQSKTNRVEAEKVADLVISHFEKYGHKKSLGVVAMSISQQEAIERAIDKKRESKRELDAYFNNNTAPFFVKNLETVQGDERDTIILSIGYAFDEQGKFLHNFGPLNQEGGERRLNVAITRAKENVKVVSSIRYTDIILSKSNALGTRLLRAYLEYASLNGKNSMAIMGENNVTGFENDVASFLIEKGYNIEQNVGYSRDKIDIGVKFPDRDEFALAIETDGLTYHKALSTRDRDRLRKENLERYGWKYYRIWSTEWYRNNRLEKDKLLKACNDAISGKSSKVEVKEKAEKFLENDHYEEFDDYVMTNDDSMIDKYLRKKITYSEFLLSFLRTEAPLNEEFFLKRTVRAFGKEKVSPTVKKEYQEKKKTLGRNIIFREDFIYLDQSDTYRLRISKKRDIKYIAKEEIAGGMMEIIKQNGQVLVDGLYKLLAQVMGYSRLTETIKGYFDKALKHLLDRELVSIKDGGVKIV